MQCVDFIIKLNSTLIKYNCNLIIIKNVIEIKLQNLDFLIIINITA